MIPEGPRRNTDGNTDRPPRRRSYGSALQEYLDSFTTIALDINAGKHCLNNARQSSKALVYGANSLPVFIPYVFRDPMCFDDLFSRAAYPIILNFCADWDDLFIDALYLVLVSVVFSQTLILCPAARAYLLTLLLAMLAKNWLGSSGSRLMNGPGE